VGLNVDLDALSAPAKLGASHGLTKFDCGEADLNDWLQKQSHKSEDGDSARTYVVCNRAGGVIAYYCLASGAIARDAATSQVRRNMPDPVPVMVIGRLAVDRDWQRHGLGPLLLKDALLRVVQAAEIIGIRAVLVHAMSDKAKAFYLKHGFQESPMNPMTLMISLKGIRRTLAEEKS
jgi:GNAT superfamily N-acetyltransferase